MKGDWLENKMRDRMENMDSPLNLAEAWAELEDRRAPERRRKYPLLWWSGFGLCLLFALPMLFLLNSQSNSEATVLDSLPVETKILSLDKNTFSELEGESDEVDRQISTIQAKRNKAKSNLEKENSQNGFFHNNINLQNNQTEINPIKSTVTVHSSSLKTEGFQKHGNTLQSIKLLNPPVLAELKSSSLENSERLSDLGLPLLNRRTKSKVKTSVFAFGLSAFYGSNRRKFHPTLGNFNEPAERRKDAEKTLDTWSLQLNFNYQNKGDLLLSSYLEFQQNTDLFEDSYTLENEIMLENQVIQVNNYPDGSTEEILGESMALESNKTIGTYYQKYRSVNFGFLAGLKKEFTASSLGVLLQAGPEVSLFRSARGTVFDINEETGSYNLLSDVVATDNINLRAVIQTELFYQAGTAGEIGLGIRLKQDLSRAFTFENAQDVFENYSETRTYYQTYLTWRKLF